MQIQEMNLRFVCEIPGRVRIKKNGKQISKRKTGKIQVRSSDVFKEWESLAQFYVVDARQRQRANVPIDEPIFAQYEFHFENRQALPDTSNCIEGPQDLLESLGVITNDKLIFKLEASRIIGSRPKTIIRLFTGKLES